jgi:hypothetical protein
VAEKKSPLDFEFNGNFRYHARECALWMHVSFLFPDYHLMDYLKFPAFYKIHCVYRWNFDFPTWYLSSWSWATSAGVVRSFQWTIWTWIARPPEELYYGLLSCFLMLASFYSLCWFFWLTYAPPWACFCPAFRFVRFVTFAREAGLVRWEEVKRSLWLDIGQSLFPCSQATVFLSAISASPWDKLT